MTTENRQKADYIGVLAYQHRWDFANIKLGFPHNLAILSNYTEFFPKHPGTRLFHNNICLDYQNFQENPLASRTIDYRNDLKLHCKWAYTQKNKFSLWRVTARFFL